MRLALLFLATVLAAGALAPSAAACTVQVVHLDIHQDTGPVEVRALVSNCPAPGGNAAWLRVGDTTLPLLPP